MSLLIDKVIFLTGGTEGIGYECAKAYHACGAKLSIISNSQESIANAENELYGDDILYIHADVANGAAISAAVDATINKYGKIDVVHNNAGISDPSKQLHETSDYEWHRLFDINVKGIFNTVRYAMPELQKSKGNILNTSSMAGQLGQGLHAAYSATKGAVSALTKSMAIDYAPHGIRVNAVAPAGVWTPMLRNWSKQQPDPSSIEKYLDDIHLLGYCPEGDVIADVCVFLISDRARFVTGCIMPVSGGAELGYRR